MRNIHRTERERGVALITTMLILLLLSSMLAGFILLVNSDMRINGMDRDNTVAFYASYGAMEKMTADLGTLFATNYAPSTAQINALLGAPPAVPGVNYTNPQGGSGYEVTYPLNVNGNPLATNGTIASGPYQGFIGLITPYTMTVTARSLNGSEVRLRRTVQTVGIPVFQFGVFSQTDLSFFPGPDFNFGGRVHTNGNLFLATGATLTLSDKVTAVGEVIRTNLSNGWGTGSGYTGTVNITTAPGTLNVRALATNEGSLTGTIPSAFNEPTWTNLSIGAYSGNLRNGRTGARQLVLPITQAGAQPIDLIKLPVQNEDVNNPSLYTQRYYSFASLRIMLADTAADITALPTVTGTAPVQLVGLVPGGGASIPPWATSNGLTAQGYWTTNGQPSIGGFIKIEMQNGAGAWIDVTQEILDLGTTGRNLSTGVLNTAGNVCAEPNPNAVIRLQRVRDVPTQNAPCGFAGATASVVAANYVPNVLFDTRQGTLRDTVPGAPNTNNVMLMGVIQYVELDINNLSRWFTGLIGATGTQANNTTGYTVFISDRRGNQVDPVPLKKLGEFGFEDFVNPTVASGAPNVLLDPGEDLNGNNRLDVYGQIPVVPANLIGAAPVGGIVPSLATRPVNYITINEARVNPELFFRRAVKIVNGTTINLGQCGVAPCGLSIVVENPVYVQGNYNANNTFGGAHVASAVLTDAFTFLSANWNDIISFTSPYTPGGRNAATTWYRVAIVAGKGISFPQPTGFATPQDFGTDGGVHNFLRFLENWGGQTLNYRGSIVSFYYNLQGVGVYKCCTTVYSPPTRGYNFDTEFLQPSLLPPRTPMFRDVNTIGFTQLILPNQ
jgi:hypothetical protein